MRWFGRSSRASVMPGPRALLRVVYLWRFSVAIAIYLSAALRVRVVAPLYLLVTSILLFSTLAFTGPSDWYSHVRNRPPGRTRLDLQALYVVALVTTGVHVPGAAGSDFQS